MLYITIRIIFWGIIFTLSCFLLTRKAKIIKKKIVVIFTFVLCMALGALSAMFPLENFFINFKSAENVFYYTCSGKIDDVVYGDNSCMIYYSTGNNSYSYLFVSKVANRYKILNYFSAKKISHKFDQNGSFDVYNVLRSDDYYIIGIVHSNGGKLEIYDGDNEQVETNIKKVKNTDFIYFYLKGYTSKYYLLINGKKVLIST